MKARVLAATAVGLVLAAAIAGTALARNETTKLITPAAVDNFRLVDNTGFAQEIRRLNDVTAIVVMSQLNGDKGSRKAAAAHRLPTHPAPQAP